MNSKLTVCNVTEISKEVTWAQKIIFWIFACCIRTIEPKMFLFIIYFEHVFSFSKLVKRHNILMNIIIFCSHYLLCGYSERTRSRNSYYCNNSGIVMSPDPSSLRRGGGVRLRTTILCHLRVPIHLGDYRIWNPWQACHVDTGMHAYTKLHACIQ